MARIASLVLLAAVVSTVSAWPQFLAMIPNSRTLDDGVVSLGHAEGTILRNQFGRDFGVGRNWTKELCQKDSDNDGQTNGQELGDPCCVWTIGRDDVLQRVNGTSNPGNKSSLADPSLFKDVDCTVYEKKAATSVSTTGAPAATTSSASRVAAGVSVALVASAMTLW